MNRYEKALERIRKVVEPTDDWSADDREHYLTIVRALEFMCAVTGTDGCPQETEPWMEAVSEIREGDRL